MNYCPLFTLLIIVSFFSMRVPTESDFFQHMTHGKAFVEKPEYAPHETWSYTAHGERWLQATFLYGVSAYVAHQVLGLTGIWLIQFFALITLALLLWRRRRHALTSWENGLLFLLIFCQIHFRLNYRGETLAYVFFFITLGWLSAALLGRTKLTWKFIAFLVVWQLWQTSVYLGLVPFGFYTLITVISRKKIAPAFFFLTAITILFFAHPNGYFVHTQWYRGIDFHRYLSIHELTPPFSRDHVYFGVLLVFSVIGIVSRNDSAPIAWLDRFWLSGRHPAKFFFLICFLFFTLAALATARTIPFAMLCGIPFYSRGFSILRAQIKIRPEVIIPIGYCAVVMLFFMVSLGRYSPGKALNPIYHPVQVADFILREKPPGNLYHPIYPAAYFLWRFQGEPPVMMDFRIDLYGTLMRELSAAEKNPELFSRFLSKYAITHAIEARHERTKAASLIFSSWILIYRDATHEVRMDPACQACAAFITKHRIQE